MNTAAPAITTRPRRVDADSEATQRAEALLTRLAQPMAWWRVWALAAIWAALTWMSFPPLGLWPLAFVSLTPLTWLALRAATVRQAMLATYVWGVALWLALSPWLVQVTIVGYPMYALLLGVYPMLFVWAFRRLSAHRWLKHVPSAILLPVIWIGIEYLRGELLFNGYPWFLLAHPIVEWPVLAQTIDAVGVYGLGLLLGATAGGLIDLAAWWRFAMLRRTLIIVWSVLLLLHGANAAYGMYRLGQDDVYAAGPAVLVIQTNLPQDNKIRWTLEEQIRDFERWVRLTLEAASTLRGRGQGFDVVVWPETMVPGFGFDPAMRAYLTREGYEPGERFTGTIERLSAVLGVPLLVGSPTMLDGRVVDGKWEAAARYNSACLVTAEPPHQQYHKAFLTPFGETMPYISAWPWLEEKMLAVGARGMRFDLAAGHKLNHLVLTADDASVRLATPICFEATVAWLCRRFVNDGDADADILVNLTNDGWFGWYDSGRRQHAQIARFRCIENRTPMIRAANTGFSMLIDSCGRMTNVIGSGRYGTPREERWMLAETQLDRRETIYSAVGDVAGALTLGVMALGLLFTVLIQSRPPARRPEQGSIE